MITFFGLIWHKFFYVPLFNVLIWLYNGAGSLGLAVIYLTVLLRLVLLPFSILSERNKHIYAKVEHEMKGIEKDFKTDPEKQREQIRMLMRKYKVSPWSKFWLLLLQVLVLIVLYQVFVGAFRSNRYEELYPSVQHPDIVFTHFIFWDLSKQNLFWAMLVGIWLFIEITIDQRRRKDSVTKGDLFYRIAFPAFSVIALYLLPMVKSLFILTSMAFSAIIAFVRNKFFTSKIPT